MLAKPYGGGALCIEKGISRIHEKCLKCETFKEVRISCLNIIALLRNTADYN